MAFKAIFVGINEHQDLTIDNLEGARLDAVALHALFTDSVPGIVARLLIDRAATKSAVEAALADVLLNADDDDTVLVSFSGHGSDEGLSLHDTDSSDPASMIGMSELARRFQGTRASRVLVLLDCCHSPKTTSVGVFGSGDDRLPVATSRELSPSQTGLA